MKIILSRKGFDSAAGKVASPILPDGTLLSLPIPSSKAPMTFGDLNPYGHAIGPLVEDLTEGRKTVYDRDSNTHLDPDLITSAYPRQKGWRPLFGQVGAAQTHLANADVGVGDLFLFFGWFRQTEQVSGKYRFVRDAPNLHVLYGWLQVGQVLRPAEDKAPRWAAYHPHFHGTLGNNNTVYVASDKLRLAKGKTMINGGGAFREYRKELVLTAPGHSRAVWKLPTWCRPRDGFFPLSYHPREASWSTQDQDSILRSAGRGQEFVLDTACYPEALLWAKNLITNSAPSSV